MTFPNPILRSAKKTTNGWEIPQNNCNKAAAIEKVDLSVFSRQWLKIFVRMMCYDAILLTPAIFSCNGYQEQTKGLTNSKENP